MKIRSRASLAFVALPCVLGGVLAAAPFGRQRLVVVRAQRRGPGLGPSTQFLRPGSPGDTSRRKHPSRDQGEDVATRTTPGMPEGGPGGPFEFFFRGFGGEPPPEYRVKASGAASSFARTAWCLPLPCRGERRRHPGDLRLGRWHKKRPKRARYLARRRITTWRWCRCKKPASCRLPTSVIRMP